MTMHDLTLEKVKKDAMPNVRVHRASDFLSDDQKREIKLARENNVAKKPRFDWVDALSAEILTRFGWEAWNAWKNGEIAHEKIVKMVLAERARSKRELLGLECIVISAVSGANNPTKSGKAPKSLKNAIKILKTEENEAKGVR